VNVAFSGKARSNFRLQDFLGFGSTSSFENSQEIRNNVRFRESDRVSIGHLEKEQLKSEVHNNLRAEPESKRMVGNMRPPPYLRVDGWRECLEEKSMGSWTSLCFPDVKPDACLSTSWEKLSEMDLPKCNDSVSRKFEDSESNSKN
jgi:hypothetical protein